MGERLWCVRLDSGSKKTKFTIRAKSKRDADEKMSDLAQEYDYPHLNESFSSVRKGRCLGKKRVTTLRYW